MKNKQLSKSELISKFEKGQRVKMMGSSYHKNINPITFYKDIEIKFKS